MIMSVPSAPRMHSEFILEEEQYCLINYHEGSQSMFLNVDFSTEHETDSVWIFPVPSNPENVDINIIDLDFSLRGYEVEEYASSKIKDIRQVMLGTQIYPGFFRFLINHKGHYFSIDESIDDSFGDKIEVHRRIEKKGLRTEVITAKDEEVLRQYLESNGVVLDEKLLEHLNLYISQDVSFVVTWMIDFEEYKKVETLENRRVGVNVIFPTEKLYYPLILTSIYDTEIIPTNIYVIGHVKPHVYDEIKPFTQVWYYIKGQIDISSNDEDIAKMLFLQNRNLQDVDYTRISIDAPSNLLKEDLYITNSAPLRIILLKFISKNANLLGLVLYLFLPILISVVLGKWIYKDDNVPIKKFVLIGACNMFSIIGFLIANNKLLKEENQKEFNRMKKTKFIVLFSLLFVLIVIGFSELTNIVLGIENEFNSKTTMTDFVDDFVDKDF